MDKRPIYVPFPQGGNLSSSSSSTYNPNGIPDQSERKSNKRSVTKSIIGGFGKLFSRRPSASLQPFYSSPTLAYNQCDAIVTSGNANSEVTNGSESEDLDDYKVKANIDAILKQHSDYIANQFKDFFSAKKDSINSGLPLSNSSFVKERAFSYPWLPPESWAVAHLEDKSSKKSYSSRVLDPDHLGLIKGQLKYEYLGSYDFSPKIVSSSEISLPLCTETQIEPQKASYSPGADSMQRSAAMLSKKINLLNLSSEFSPSALAEPAVFAPANPVWWIRVWKSLRRGSLPCQSSSFSSIGSKDLLSFSTIPFGFVTVSCALEVTTKELLSIASSKFSNSFLPVTSSMSSSASGELYVVHRGVARILHSNDKPIMLQKKWFEQLGYSDLAKLPNLGLQDHSYVCQFIYFDSGDASNCLSLISNENHLNDSSVFPTDYQLTQSHAILPARNLLVLPVKLFQLVSSIEILDISRNPMISIPTDFIQSCSRLKTIVLTSCELDMVPRSIPFCSTLTTLILRDNLLNEDSLDCLCLLKNLETLDLTANHLSYLPLSLVTLTKLKSLNLSSNGITTLPSVLFHLKSLEFLDLSFNFITSLQEEICHLENLTVLILAYNRIRTLEPQFSNLAKLDRIDIRGNNISDINMLLSSGSLSSINAQYNSISKFQLVSQGSCISVLNLDNNSLSSIEVPSPICGNFFCFHTLTELMICSSKLVSLPEALFTCCPNIVKLRLDNNQLKELPCTFGNISSTLVSLSISNNKLTSLPNSICLFKKLISLDLHENNLSSLPMALLSCRQLLILNISSNLLSSLPSLSFHSADAIDPDCYPRLQLLNVSDNQLKDDSLGFILSFSKLRILNISHNFFTEISVLFNYLFKLRVFIASGNEIMSISEDIGSCYNLEYLFLNGNRLLSIPAEISKLSGLVALDISDNHLRYNINNWPYDWHWQWNSELIYLNLSGNTRFELHSFSHETLDNTSNSNYSVFLDSFKGLHNIQFLDLSNVKSLPEVLPVECWSTRVKTLLNGESSECASISHGGECTPTSSHSFSFDKSPKKGIASNSNAHIKEKKSSGMMLNLSEPLFRITSTIEENSAVSLMDNFPASTRSACLPSFYGASCSPPICMAPIEEPSSSYSNCSIHDLVNSKIFRDITESQCGVENPLALPLRSRQVNSLWDFVNFSFLKEKNGFENILLALFDGHFNGEVAYFLYKSFSDAYYGELKNSHLKKLDLTPFYKISREDVSKRRNSIVFTAEGSNRESDLIYSSMSSQENSYGCFSSSPFSTSSYSSTLSKEEVYFEPEDISSDALKATFLNLNRNLSALKFPNGSGCSALVAHISCQRLFVANIGDSLAVLSRSGYALVLSKIHTGFNRSERARVRSSGGFVTVDQGKIHGIAPLTRSFGYFELCPSVIADPSIHIVHITPHDDFLILANAELWSWIDPQTAVDIALSTGGNLRLAASKLRDIAIAYGSKGVINIQIISLSAHHVASPSSCVSPATSSPFSGSDSGLRSRSFNHSSSGTLSPIRKPHFADRDKERISCAKESLFYGASSCSVMDSSLARLKTEIDPPTGNLAIVFTDIRSSTLLWELIPSAMEAAIKVHNSILRRLLRTIGGYEVKTDGDAFMVTFPDPLSALKWCIYGQIQLLQADWPQKLLECPEGRPIYTDSAESIHQLQRDTESSSTTPLENYSDKKPVYRGLAVRMGIHYGTPICELDPITQRMDYFGLIVNRAARIAGIAHGGQICISSDAYEECMKRLSQDSSLEASLLFPSFYSLGTVRLRGLESAELIYSVYPETLKPRKHLLKSSSEPNVSTEQLKNIHDIGRRLEAIASFMYNEAGLPL